MTEELVEALRLTAAMPAIDPAEFWETRASMEARRLAQAMAEIDALSDEILRLYNTMRPVVLRYPMSHLCWHRKRKIREKWRKRLGGPWIKLAPGAFILNYEGEDP